MSQSPKKDLIIGIPSSMSSKKPSKKREYPESPIISKSLKKLKLEPEKLKIAYIRLVESESDFEEENPD